MPPLRLTYLGPPGTFSEEAALRYAPAADRLPAPSITSAAVSVAEGRADEAIVPIENSLEGSVTETLDLLVHRLTLCLCHEIILPIEHCLIAAPGVPVAAVRAVYSHPQALAQCRAYLDRRLPQAERIAALSTVQAVETVLGRPDAAAIAPRRAATLHQAALLEAGIQDDPRNRTRFVVLAPHDAAPTGDDKTSLAFNVVDRPGALVHVLQIFAAAGINLTKIESRPAREDLGVYVFLVDLNGHRLDSAVAAVLEQVRRATTTLKILGSYPRHRDS